MAVPDYKLSAVLCGHSLDVRCVAKTKEFCILSASRDRTAKLWHPEGLVYLICPFISVNKCFKLILMFYLQS